LNVFGDYYHVFEHVTYSVTMQLPVYRLSAAIKRFCLNLM